MSERQSPGGAFIVETATQQRQSPGYAYINETYAAAGGSIIGPLFAAGNGAGHLTNQGPLVGGRLVQ